MNPAVCIPCRGREENLAAVREVYDGLGWPVYIGDHEGDPFSRSWAINAAARQAIAEADPDVLLLADADFFFPHQSPLRQAVERALADDCYVIPFHEMLVLGEEGSAVARAGLRIESRHVIEGVGYIWVGACAVSRTLWDRVCGFDERFVGYGSEDLGFVAACNTMGTMFKQRIHGTVYHLAHAPNDERDRYNANAELASRYRSCDGDRAAMLALLAERGCLPTVADPDTGQERLPL